MRRMLKKGIGGFLLMLMTAAVIAEVAQAGSLEPSASPNPTMKTLDQVQPTWDQVLSADVRFQTVMGGKGVLDKETGLVWEQTPNNTATDWYTALSTCFTSYVGDRHGWRLPTIEELESLMINTVQSPALPSGNPFFNVQSGLFTYYWSATTNAGDSTSVWANYPAGGGASTHPKSTNNGGFLTWCVRGGHGNDGQ